MLQQTILVVFVCGLAFVSGCKKRDNPPPTPKTQTEATPVRHEPGPVKHDACILITTQEVEAIGESPVRDTKNSGRSDEGLSFAQCFYATAESNLSVSLAVTQPDPDASPQRNIKELWKQMFGTTHVHEKEEAEDKEKRESLREQKNERKEEEQSVPPTKVEGIGEEAFWIGSRVGGALYVLRKNVFIRVSVGGPDPQEKKIEKCKALAEKALGRL